MTATLADPRHTFLTRPEVFARYRWGRSAGYARMAEPGFPPALPGGVWRLDTLLAWEDAVLAGAPAPVAPVAEPETIAAPPRRRAGRKAAA